MNNFLSTSHIALILSSVVSEFDKESKFSETLFWVGRGAGSVEGGVCVRGGGGVVQLNCG